jgi:hypothetical protein
MGRAAHASVAALAPESVIRDFESLLMQLARESHHVQPAATRAHA